MITISPPGWLQDNGSQPLAYITTLHNMLMGHFEASRGDHNLPRNLPANLLVLYTCVLYLGLCHLHALKSPCAETTT